MKKKLAITIMLIVILLLGITVIIWFKSQNVTEGYIYSADESELWVIELNEEDVEGKNTDEINLLLERKATESQGVFYDIPFVNEVINSDYEKGDKVKIRWSGVVHQSLPAAIEGTVLITEIK